MAESAFFDIPVDDWVNVSNVTGNNALVTNVSEQSISYIYSVAKPPQSIRIGHKFTPGSNPLTFALDKNESVWMRGISFGSKIIYTPSLAVGNLGGALNVHDADVHNIPANDFAHLHGVETTLAAQANAGDTSITLTSAVGFAVDSYVHMGPTTESLEPVHPQITQVVGNVVTLDRPLDFTYLAGDSVSVSLVNMVVNSVGASLTTPISFKYRPHAGRVEHITRLLITMIHGVAGADDLFGGAIRLTNGVVIRAHVNGETSTFTNWKTNGDIRLDTPSVTYSDKVGPGNFGTSVEGSLEDIGVAARLDPDQGDYLEVLWQDDVSATNLVDFRLKWQGHVEGE